MPNVAGVQFPYTPQGQQAAQLYQGSLSPRQGLGFRPVGMENGGSPEASPQEWLGNLGRFAGSAAVPFSSSLVATGMGRDFALEDRAMLESARRVVTELYALDSEQEILNYINQSRSDLEYIARLDNPMFDMLRGLLKRYPPQSNLQDAPMLSYLPDPAELPAMGYEAGPGAGPGERFARRRGRHLPPMAEPPREEEGLGSMADSPGYHPELNSYFPPEREWGPPGGIPGMSHGGVPGGTVAGELPRYGGRSVREEGETMAELSKRHRDQDWYNRMGGGLGSLRSRMA